MVLKSFLTALLTLTLLPGAAQALPRAEGVTSYTTASIFAERYSARARVSGAVTGFPQNAGAPVVSVSVARMERALPPMSDRTRISLFGAMGEHILERLRVDNTLRAGQFGAFTDGRGGIKRNPVFEMLTESRVEPALHATVTGEQVKPVANRQIAASEVIATPLPAAAWMFIAGAGALFAWRRRPAA